VGVLTPSPHVTDFQTCGPVFANPPYHFFSGFPSFSLKNYWWRLPLLKLKLIVSDRRPRRDAGRDRWRLCWERF